MFYHSTRSTDNKVDSARAVVQGLAPDGGLYMPESIPGFDWKACLNGSAQEMSSMILSALLPEIPNMPTATVGVRSSVSNLPVYAALTSSAILS